MMANNNSWGGSTIGINYRGNRAQSPVNITYNDRDPGQYDTQNVVIGDEWINTSEDTIWKLISLGQTAQSQGFMLATWVEITNSSGTLLTLSSNTGDTVDPDGSGNISIVGDGTTITGVGDSTTNTITLSSGDLVATQYDADSGSAIPSTGVLDISGGLNISTAGATNVLTFNLSGTTQFALQVGNILGSLTSLSVGATGTILQGNTAANPSFTGSPSVSGSVTAATNITSTLGNITATQGNVVVTLGNLVMPSSYNAGATSGVIKFGSRRMLTTNGSDNLFVGLDCGNTTLTGVNNSVFGNGSFMLATTSAENLIIGNNVMTTATTGANGNMVSGNASYNVGVGNNNCIIGGTAMVSATTASGNTTLGHGAGWDSGSGLGLITGTANILIGNGAGSAYRGAESNNIILGNGDGVLGESSVMHLGDTQTKTFIMGVRGITTDVNDAVAVLIDSAGQLGTISSSSRYKENIEDMGNESEVIYNLRPVVFNYKKDSSRSMQVGLIAEEVVEVAPRLAVYDSEGNPETVKYHELPQLILNELIKLRARVEELEKILIR